MLVETRFVLTQIPAHELGSAELVNGLLHLVGSMAVLEMVALLAVDGKEFESGQDSVSTLFGIVRTTPCRIFAKAKVNALTTV